MAGWISSALIAGLIVSAAPATAHAAGDEAARALALVRAAYGKIGGLTASFVQVEERPEVGATLREEGTLSFRPPDRMRWDYGGERPHRVVVAGDLVWIHTPSRNQVMRRRMTAEEMRRGPATFLGGLDRIEEDFDVQARQAPAGGPITLDLFPLAERSPFDKVQVAVEPKSGLISRIAIHHRIGNVTTMTFSDVRTGVKLKDSLFAYDVPEGTEVVEP